MKLTEELLKKRRPPISGQQFVWDELVTGFGARFTPTTVAFCVQWRQRDGSKKRETFRPRWPALKVEDARNLARKRLGEELGTKEAGSDIELRHAMRAWYHRQIELNAWRPKYRHKIDALISTYVEGEERPRLKLRPKALAAVDALGRKPVGAVTRGDVMAVVDNIKPGIGEQFMAVLSSFFGAMLERDVVTSNPARNRLKVTGGRRIRRRKITEDEFLNLWHAFEKEGDPNLGAFAMLAHTGARRGEVTGMRWDELNLKKATWTLPPERRKNGKKDPQPFVISLHPNALETIKRQPELKNSPYVFWGRRDKKHFDFQHLLIDRVRQVAAIDNWRLHDLRRFIRSGMARLGVREIVAEMCLGHIAKDDLGKAYNQHEYLDERAAAWHQWGDYLATLTARVPG